MIRLALACLVLLAACGGGHVPTDRSRDRYDECLRHMPAVFCPMP